MNSLVLERPAFISLGLFKCLALPPLLPQMPSPREGASIDFFCLAFFHLETTCHSESLQ